MDNSTLRADHSNGSYVLTNSTTYACPKPRSVNVFVTLLYVVGIVGNALAIITLRRGERRVRNRKYLLLLTSLAANDLVALLGMMFSMLVGSLQPWVTGTRAFCMIRVVLRLFGVGSGCIAVTMALERYLALTRPFLYQKQVTYYVIRSVLLGSYLWAAALACAPIAGFGRYYDSVHKCCIRYRNAVTTTDFVYAGLYVFFGTLLCVVLVYCNIAVMLALKAIRAPPGAHNEPIVRRVSKSICMQRQRSVTNGQPPAPSNFATTEEASFGRLMAALSFLFLLCWLPQMVTSTLHLSLEMPSPKWLTPLAITSDMLMLLNYVLNPVLYVQRSRWNFCFNTFCRSVARCFKRGHKNSNDSMKNSCCPQELTVSSDTSAVLAEMKPLRVQPHPSGDPHSGV